MGEFPLGICVDKQISEHNRNLITKAVLELNKSYNSYWLFKNDQSMYENLAIPRHLFDISLGDCDIFITEEDLCNNLKACIKGRAVGHTVFPTIEFPDIFDFMFDWLTDYNQISFRPSLLFTESNFVITIYYDNQTDWKFNTMPAEIHFKNTIKHELLHAIAIPHIKYDYMMNTYGCFLGSCPISYVVWDRFLSYYTADTK